MSNKLTFNTEVVSRIKMHIKFTEHNLPNVIRTGIEMFCNV